MQPFIGEIRSFGGNFAPRGWAFCDGQLIAISENQALFSLLGTTYGGDGRTTFGLPELRGRAAMGAGDGPGLSPRPLGQKSGTEENFLQVNQLAQHHHNAAGTIRASAGNGDTGEADGNALAHQSRGNTVPTIYNSAAASINMHPNSASVTLNNTGGNRPVNNMGPSMVLNYIIALEGLYPSRS